MGCLLHKRRIQPSKELIKDVITLSVHHTFLVHVHLVHPRTYFILISSSYCSPPYCALMGVRRDFLDMLKKYFGALRTPLYELLILLTHVHK